MVKTKSQGLICPKLDSVVVVSMTDLIAIIHHAAVQTWEGVTVHLHCQASNLPFKLEHHKMSHSSNITTNNVIAPSCLMSQSCSREQADKNWQTAAALCNVLLHKACSVLPACRIYTRICFVNRELLTKTSSVFLTPSVQTFGKQMLYVGIKLRDVTHRCCTVSYV